MRPMSCSKVHIITELFKLAEYQILVFTSIKKWRFEIKLRQLKYIYVVYCDIFCVSEIIEVNNEGLRII